ncbi:MAG TPA: hypothetical protein VKB46_10415 [Pyrinomonadaceae bacterium]|nr:hypothetical protein [Pyrinomonadaceae bacterium]
MFTIGEGKFSQQIFINYKASDVQQAAAGDRDYIVFGSTFIPHEKVQRGGNANEVDAYKEQRRVLDRMPGAFTDLRIYLFFREQINRRIIENGGRP